MKKILFVSICLLALASCKRKGDVTGKVLNAIDGSPVEGVDVRVTYSADDLSNSDKTTSIQLASTDAAGDYRINAVYNTKIGYEYYVSLNPNDAFDKTNQFFVKDTTANISKTFYYFAAQYSGISQDIKPIKKTKKSQNFELKAATCARLKIVARNVLPINDSDKIVVTLVDNKLKDGGVEIFSNKVKETPAIGNYSLIPTVGKASLKWVVTDLSGTRTFYDTISVVPYTKATFRINY